MKTKTQDPKFYIETDNDCIGEPFHPRLVGQSGPVPEDEPLFILRGRDVNAWEVLNHYKRMAEKSGANDDHLEAIESRIREFGRFGRNNPDRMKVPDTDLTQLHDGKP